jgi:hypothetical protein
MSEIKVDSLTGKTTANDITVTVGATATMSLQQSTTKVFATIDGTGTIALLKSLNVSSLTDAGTGQYDTNFLNSFSDIVYTPHGNAKESTGSARNADVDRAFQSARRPHTTSTCQWFAMTFAGADSDVEEAYALIHGDLA